MWVGCLTMAKKNRQTLGCAIDWVPTNPVYKFVIPTLSSSSPHTWHGGLGNDTMVKPTGVGQVGAILTDTGKGLSPIALNSI